MKHSDLSLRDLVPLRALISTTATMKSNDETARKAFDKGKPMIELEHSPLGGSAAHRFMNCEGSFLLQREQIEAGTFVNIESEYAKLGTAAHELGAKAIATGLGAL
jgi:hypothetical protein